MYWFLLDVVVTFSLVIEISHDLSRNKSKLMRTTTGPPSIPAHIVHSHESVETVNTIRVKIKAGNKEIYPTAVRKVVMGAFRVPSPTMKDGSHIKGT